MRNIYSFLKTYIYNWYKFIVNNLPLFIFIVLTFTLLTFTFRNIYLIGLNIVTKEHMINNDFFTLFLAINVSFLPIIYVSNIVIKIVIDKKANATNTSILYKDVTKHVTFAKILLYNGLSLF